MAHASNYFLKLTCKIDTLVDINKVHRHVPYLGVIQHNMINELVEYCDIEFDQGNPCNNHACAAPKNCVNCLAAIHNGSGRDYDCNNMISHYVCTYIYKYSSEVAHLFRHFNNFQNMEQLDILSIGCGPCSDLFAAHHTFDEKEINYHGFDLNTRWQPVHNKIEDIFQNQQQVSPNFHYQDVFQVFPNLNFNPNILTGVCTHDP